MKTGESIGIMYGLLIGLAALGASGIIYGATRSQVASECRRDGFVWIDGAKYTCTKVSPV